MRRWQSWGARHLGPGPGSPAHRLQRLAVVQPAIQVFDDVLPLDSQCRMIQVELSDHLVRFRRSVAGDVARRAESKAIRAGFRRGRDMAVLVEPVVLVGSAGVRGPVLTPWSTTQEEVRVVELQRAIFYLRSEMLDVVVLVPVEGDLASHCGLRKQTPFRRAALGLSGRGMPVLSFRAGFPSRYVARRLRRPDAADSIWPRIATREDSPSTALPSFSNTNSASSRLPASTWSSNSSNSRLTSSSRSGVSRIPLRT